MSLQHTNAKKQSILFKLGLVKWPHRMPCSYRGDGIGVKGKGVSFMDDPVFAAAWEKATSAISATMGEPVADIRWRAHIALWAAKQGLQREGDFIECGVFSGILSSIICHALDFGKYDRRFLLFDTWNGVPVEGLPEGELKIARWFNGYYHKHDIYEDVKKNFAAFQNCHLVRGALPGTLDTAGIEKVAYLSIDLNNAGFEKDCIERLWPKLSPGAIVVLDDYNFYNCHVQREMWDTFAAERNLMVAALPTGQGILIKP